MLSNRILFLLSLSPSSSSSSEFAIYSHSSNVTTLLFVRLSLCLSDRLAVVVSIRVCHSCVKYSYYTEISDTPVHEFNQSE